MSHQIQMKKTQEWVNKNHLQWSAWVMPEQLRYAANDSVVGELAVPLTHLPIIRSWIIGSTAGQNFIEQTREQEWALQMTEQQMALTDIQMLEINPTLHRQDNAVTAFFKAQRWKKKQAYANKVGVFDVKALIDRLANLQLTQQRAQVSLPASVGLIECSSGKMGKLFAVLPPSALESSVMLFDPEMGLFKLGSWAQAGQMCQSYFKLLYGSYTKQAALALYLAG